MGSNCLMETERGKNKASCHPLALPNEKEYPLTDLYFDELKEVTLTPGILSIKNSGLQKNKTNFIQSY